MTDRPHLRALAEYAGILPSYIDVTGTERHATDDARVAILAALGLDASTEEAAQTTLASLWRGAKKRMLLPTRVVRAADRGLRRIDVHVPEGVEGPVDWRMVLTEEGGETHASHGRARPNERDATLRIRLPGMPPPGYHTLRVGLSWPGRNIEATQSLIVAPASCAGLRERLGDRRAYGVWANLYSLRSRGNWGFGDLTDLSKLIRGTAKHGADFVGLNPIHTLLNRHDRIGPYCPVSRLYRNILYIDIEAIPEFSECRQAQQCLASVEFQAKLGRVREATHIEYELVAELKTRIMRLLHRSFMDKQKLGPSERTRKYAAYVATQGVDLERFATFMALESHLTEVGNTAVGLNGWPTEYRRYDSPAVRDFREAHGDDVSFHCYVQFELDRQLAGAADEARRAGMALGLYQDLAVGSAADGSDAWAYPDTFVTGIEVGAPPDPYSETGQTWGFPPLNPMRLAQSRYHYWIRLLQSVPAQAGMLRIDHILGLFRQYWVPEGFSPVEGAYVRFPARDLLGIIALESRRQGVIIVGEDLGTVPRGTAAALARWGILSSRVMYFERNRRGTFRPAKEYSKRALVTATTHDHPPLAGFWTGRDLELRNEIALLDEAEELAAAIKDRKRSRKALLRRLQTEGLAVPVAETPFNDPSSGHASFEGDENEHSVGAGPSSSKDEPGPVRVQGAITRLVPPGLCAAVYEFLARTPCPLVGISLDDLAGERDPINLPGVDLTHYPSWSRRMQGDIKDLLADPKIKELLAGMPGLLRRHGSAD